MCGIAAILKLKKSEIDLKKSISLMLNSLEHRGPDDLSYTMHDNFSMGMTRLSIIDLKSGNQPIFDKSKRYSIVFNGEIYNYRELRAELERKDIPFSTESDTEVILQGFIYWGDEVVKKLNGMFAFIIYDSLEKKIFIARDRLGKKPLYYYKDEEKIIISSEVNAIASLKENIQLNIDEQSYWDFLTYRYIPGKSTSYNQIKKFTRSSIYKISPEKISNSPYWHIPKAIKDHESKFDTEITQNFEKLFSESVKKRLIADVPIGIILSGGLDSSAILYEASKHKKMSSYHVTFPDDGRGYDELKFAKKMANFSNSELKVVEIRDLDLIDQLYKISDITDEPLSDLASIPFKMVCDLAAQDVKVVLSGEGCDEIMGGYDLHRLKKNLSILDLLNLYPKLSKILKFFVRLLIKERYYILDDIGIKAQNWPEKKLFNIIYQINHDEKIEYLNNKDLTFENSDRILQKQYDKIKNFDPINKILNVISEDWLVENVLMKSDKVSMSSSIECRCPFLDYELVEFLFKLHGDYKISKINKKIEPKFYLKNYLNGKIPGEIIFRKKMGFPVRAYKLDKKIYQNFIYDIISSKNAFFIKYFSQDKIKKLFSTVIKSNNSKLQNKKDFLWSLAIYELWYKKINKKI